MATPNLQSIAELFAKDGQYVRFCKELRSIAQQYPVEVEQLLLQSATDLIAKPDFETSKSLQLSLQKAALALAVLAGTQTAGDDQWQMLERTLIRLMKDANSSEVARHILASELTYLDQYLEKAVRRLVLKEVRGQRIRPLTPSIADYLEAWKGLEDFEKYSQIVGKPDKRKDLTVYFVCSAKGGVGKSLTALSLMRFLADSSSADSRVAIIDMDPSGPTLQFSLDVPAVSKTHALLPYDSKDQVKPVWCYWSFLDVLRAASDNSECGQPNPAQACIFGIQGRGLENVSAVLLPDSPTYSATTATYWGSDIDRQKIILALSAVFDQLIQQKCQHVVLDCGPGLGGVNGFLLQWASHRYLSHLLVLGSSNAPDIGTTLYEALWSAAGEFGWDSKPFFLVNRWPTGIDLIESLDRWTERFVSIASQASVKGDHKATTSATQIYSSRMWTYLYLTVLQDKAPLRMRGLNEEEALSHMFFLPSDGPFVFPWQNLIESKWYRDVCSVFSILLNTPKKE